MATLTPHQYAAERNWRFKEKMAKPRAVERRILAELFLVNHGGDTLGGIDYAAPPPLACNDTACAPGDGDAGLVIVRFQRRANELGARPLSGCAYAVVPSFLLHPPPSSILRPPWT